jgi:hypothetical protein
MFMKTAGVFFFFIKRSSRKKCLLEVSIETFPQNEVNACSSKRKSKFERYHESEVHACFPNVFPITFSSEMYVQTMTSSQLPK